MALVAAGCQSELGDGNPSEQSGFIPPGGPGSVAGPGTGPGTGGPNGVVTPGTEGNPTPTGSVDRPPANILGASDGAPLWDEQGNPLPVDQLPALASCNTPGPQVLRRLNTPQFRNTLTKVFGDGMVPDSNPLNDARTLGYFVDSDDLLVQNLDAQAIGGLSEEISAAVVANTALMQQLTNNCMDLNNASCAQQFVQNLGEKLFREPLTQEQASNYQGLFTAQSNGVQLVSSFNDGAELVIQAMVQSPYMIYRREIGTQQGGEYVLSPFEIASELSYMLTNNPPDDELMAAARNGQLSSTDQILAQADRLVATPEAASVLGGFVTAWLDLDRVNTQVKAGIDISPELRGDMLEETRQLFVDVYRNGGTIGDLFSATYTFMDQRLADFYGMSGMVTSQDFQKIDTAAGARVPGLLGHGSYLAAHALVDNSSPVQRAFVVRERILCNDMPPVPTDLDTNLKAPAPGATSRERYTAHSSNQVCYTCHQLMDPVGFTFEGFDGYGLPRATESNKPVDTTGSLPLMDGGEPVGISVPMSSVTDLAMYLSQSEQARACLISNLAYYSYGIANDAKWSTADKSCTDNYIRQMARDSGNTLQSVVDGILTAPHFTRRVQAK